MDVTCMNLYKHLPSFYHRALLFFIILIFGVCRAKQDFFYYGTEGIKLDHSQNPLSVTGNYVDSYAWLPTFIKRLRNVNITTLNFTLNSTSF
jgi:hypothetical protein